MKFLVAAAAAVMVAGSSAGTVSLLPGKVEVVISSEAGASVKFAAAEATNFLSRVLGAKVPLVSEPSSGAHGVSIVLGSNVWTRAAGIDTAALKRDAFVTKVEAGRVYIAGRDDPKADLTWALAGRTTVPFTERATLFGVYQFLEDVAGCRFFFPGEYGTVVPRAERLEVEKGEKTISPSFTVRDPYLYFAKAARPGETAAMSEEARKTFRARHNALDWLRLRLQTERIPCCHGQTEFMYTDRFRESHPEYLRLKEDGTRATELEVNGNRYHWSIRDLCHTSKVWDEMYEDVKAYLTGKSAASRRIPSKWNKSKFGWNSNCVGGRYVDIMPQDGFQRCCCENCRKAYTDEQHYATDLIWNQTAKLANRLKAEGIKGYVTQMAYTPYARVPEVALPDNVMVMVARTGPWMARNPKVLEKEFADYRAWSEKVDGKVWVWTYPHKYGKTAIPDVPCMAPKAWGMYYQRAAKWIFGTFAECETDRAIFNYLNYYVFSKVAWNPDVDINAVLDDHYAKMFGAGAAEMKVFYEELEDAWLKVAGNIVWNEVGPQASVPSDYTLACEIYSPRVLARWSKLCETAAEKNASDKEAQKRVNFVKSEFIDKMAANFRRYVDEISVEKALARRAAEPKRENLVNPKGWSIYPSRGAVPIVDETVKGPTGENTLHVRAVDNKAYLTMMLNRKPHTLKPNTRYRLSCFVKANGVVPLGKGGIYLEINNGIKNWAESGHPDRRFSGTTDWAYQEMEFKTIGEIIPKAFICLRIFNASGEAWFDGVRLEELE